MANISTPGESTMRNIIEEVLGGILVLGGVYKLSRNTYAFTHLLYNYRKYLQIDSKKKHTIGGLIANPALKEVVILDIFCNANK